MEHAHVRTRRLPPLPRGFERSRLEEQLIATAYELAVPICRQTLAVPPRSRDATTGQEPPAAHKGGLWA